MNALKSLKEFATELNCLDSKQLKQVTGGMTKTWYTLTSNGLDLGRSCADHRAMHQNYVWDGAHWQLYGPEYTTGVTYDDPKCLQATPTP